jgi:hypothetical protein
LLDDSGAILVTPLSGGIISIDGSKLKTWSERISAKFASDGVRIGVDTRLILEKGRSRRW